MADDTTEKDGNAEKAPESAQSAARKETKSTADGTGEIGGPEGPEPTRYGDWEKKGRCIDF
ncbi:MAG: DUF1674 domain-containing protein [Rhodospirillales bacterium]